MEKKEESVEEKALLFFVRKQINKKNQEFLRLSVIISFLLIFMYLLFFTEIDFALKIFGSIFGVLCIILIIMIFLSFYSFFYGVIESKRIKKLTQSERIKIKNDYIEREIENRKRIITTHERVIEKYRECVKNALKDIETLKSS